MIVPEYYYVIVGGGLAGLQLASEIQRNVFFHGKKVAIIDPSLKTENDKTWCFWEKGDGQWDHIVHKSWNKGKFVAKDIDKSLKLGDYTYKMIRSIDLYKELKDQLRRSDNFYFIQDEIEKIDPVTRTAVGKKANYTATHFFDSRPTEAYKNDKNSNLIYQHFKGWVVETENESFDPDVFTMMDYRLKYEDSTSFTYILPITSKKALIEYTFFTPFLTEETVYDEMLTRYIENILQLKHWKITETEKGVIPMTDFPFKKTNSRHITKIGTGGGWVKPSSGYSFRNTEKKVQKIIENLKAGFATTKGIYNRKFRKYDAIFLDVLYNNNELGESLFSKLYSKNSMEEIFRFLDEETGFNEDLKIMLSLYHPEFIRSFFRKL
ncbi:lycopene cyclase family protein [Christiangramia salexigens]|uniref:Lycopene cyclase n=1 Tax=Christiangramia salexigens TaxID=1913577 RepID=A0A1L3J1C8_9FLAO|nr:lycopene cyclase family protein [Christiangramia salexigens]APG58932.1 lycopene cyclase [Christiangramia salexigens]